MTAAEYRAHAAEMIKCAGAARSEDERLEYYRLAKAWTMLAEGAERGLNPDEACAEPEPAG